MGFMSAIKSNLARSKSTDSPEDIVEAAAIAEETPTTAEEVAPAESEEVTPEEPAEVEAEPEPVVLIDEPVVPETIEEEVPLAAEAPQVEAPAAEPESATKDAPVIAEETTEEHSSEAREEQIKKDLLSTEAQPVDPEAPAPVVAPKPTRLARLKSLTKRHTASKMVPTVIAQPEPTPEVSEEAPEEAPAETHPETAEPTPEPAPEGAEPHPVETVEATSEEVPQQTVVEQDKPETPKPSKKVGFKIKDIVKKFMAKKEHQKLVEA